MKIIKRYPSYEIKKQYMQVIPFLSIKDTRVYTIKSKEYSELKEEVDYLKGIVEMIIDPKNNKTSEFMESRADVLKFVEKNKDKILK